jgi:hypothetical protein
MTRAVNTRDTARDLDFTLYLDADGRWPTEKVLAALLADIRAELRELNRTLSCFRVRRMSDDINRIDTRLRVAGMLANKRGKK